MPTSVSVARQCLTPEAAHALDEAVAVARRRGHSQTTSLHAVSALLSLPSSSLREACARARNCSYSPRLQFKALDLCLNVSLDRVSSGQLNDDPPVSNSLMAAIKRSQANQRRQPENFHLYHQLQQSHNSSVAVIKVELQQLILSILDDPVVSRVFSEAGFRSSEIKLAILRPLPQLYKFSRSRAPPPIFLCNLNDNPGRRGSGNSFPGFGGFLDADENCKRIGEVLMKRKNPLLVGVCAYGALQDFSESLERKYKNPKKSNNFNNIFPLELYGLNIINLENEISRFINENGDSGGLNMKIEEVGSLIQGNLGSGVAVSYGDLKIFLTENRNENGDIDSNSKSDAANYVVAQLTRLLKLHGDKVRLMGAVATYETYSRFVTKFSSIEKDWDLQLLTITSLRHSSKVESYSYTKSSLMESFVPFGGFFSTSSDFKNPLNGSYQSICRRCSECNEKCNQEVLAFSKIGLTSSVADQCQSCLPSWLQMAEVGSDKGFDSKIKDDETVLNAKVTELQKKWDGICQNLHRPHPGPKSEISQVGSPFSTVTGFQFLDNNKHETNVNDSNCTNAPTKEQKEGFLSKLLKTKTKGVTESSCCLSNSSFGDVTRASLQSDTSVTTNLGLGISSDQSSSSSNPNLQCLFDLSNFKALFTAFTERVNWQDEAISVICQEITQWRLRNENRSGRIPRGDIWFKFIGPDRRGKEKIAIALAEIVYGNKENFCHADLSSERIIDRQDAGTHFRGKTMIDYVVGKILKKPLSVVFLENLDKADVYTRSSLLKAIQTGKFSNSHGREVSVNNTIFVTTSTFVRESKIISPGEDNLRYSEENILQVKRYPFYIVTERALDQSIDASITMREVNKRKLIGQNENTHQLDVAEIAKRAHCSSTRYLDLNIPANVDDEQDGDDRFWDSFNQKVKTISFKPFDFDALADGFLNHVNESFHKIFRSHCSLEIDSKVVEQLLAFGYLSDNIKLVKNWIDNVLRNAFVEVEKRYNLPTHSIVKLVAYEDRFSEEPEQGVWLPPEIILK